MRCEVATTEAEQGVLDYLRFIASARSQLAVMEPMGSVYSCPEDFILREGEFWTPQPLPSEFLPMTPKQCFLNAALTASGSYGRLRYVEGFAASILVVHHAWCVDEEGRVIDPTWAATGGGVGSAYRGTVFPPDRPGRSWIDDWENNWPLLNGGVVPDGLRG